MTRSDWSGERAFSATSASNGYAQIMKNRQLRQRGVEETFDAFSPFQMDMVAEGDAKGIKEMYAALIKALDGADVLNGWNPNLCDLMRSCFTDSLDGGDWGDGLDFLIEKR